jgi:hypothetical protein
MVFSLFYYVIFFVISWLVCLFISSTLVSHGAWDWAVSHGIQTVPREDLITGNII